MNLLDYHKDIDDYIMYIYNYQVIIKPFNDKLTKINLKEKLKITAILMIFGTILLINNILIKIRNIKQK